MHAWRAGMSLGGRGTVHVLVQYVQERGGGEVGQQTKCEMNRKEREGGRGGGEK